MEGWKMILLANGIQKQAGVSKLIYDKIDFKTKLEETKDVTAH
jgi:hypothetical protein